MSSANSAILKQSEAYPVFRKVFLYYNLYVRNLKFFFKNSQSQFGEDKKIVKLFLYDKKGIYLDLGCFHPIRQNNTYLLHKLGWKGINIDLNPLSIELFNLARPNDYNVNAAVSNRNKKYISYYTKNIINTLGTTVKTVAKTSFLKGNYDTRRTKCMKLNNIISKNYFIKDRFYNFF